jgi:putative transposase
LTPTIEPLAYRALKHKIVNWPGAFVHDIGGIDTHVHLVVSIAPTILISEFIGQIKGASSYEVNQQAGRSKKVLEWQPGYGIVSFGTKDLPWVLEYVRNQREHHATGRIHDRLERITQLDDEAQAAQREAP